LIFLFCGCEGCEEAEVEIEVEKEDEEDGPIVVATKVGKSGRIGPRLHLTRISNENSEKIRHPYTVHSPPSFPNSNTHHPIYHH